MRVSAGFIERVAAEEGFSAKAYWDDAPGGGGGQWTWGYGTRAVGPGCIIGEAEARAELAAEIAEAEADFAAVFSEDPPGITQARYDSIVDMLFNLGLSRFAGFHYTIGAIKEGNWIRAAAHAQQSLWYKQVGKRAQRIVEELRTGVDLYQWVPVSVKSSGDTGVPKPGSPDSTGIPPTGGTDSSADVRQTWWGKLLGIVERLFVLRCGDSKNLRGGGLT